MKKLFVIIMAAALILVLSACNSGAKPAASPTQEPTAAPAEPMAEPTAEPAEAEAETVPESSESGGRKTIEEIAADLKAAKAEKMYESTAFVTIDTIEEIFQIQSFPCTYFVNNKGEVLGEPVFGPELDKYQKLVDEYLAAAE